MTRYPTLRDPTIRDVLQAKLYSISRRCLMQMYRTLELALNKDTTNIVLQYIFGDTRRVLDAGEEDWLAITGGNILMEADFDAFLQYELY